MAKKLTFVWWYDEKRLGKIRKLFKQKELEVLNATHKDFTEWARTYESYMPAVLLVFSVDKLVFDRLHSLLVKKNEFE
jgi:hypothetical protein